MQNAVKTYLQTQVSTTTQGDLVIMLYDAALKFLHQAKERIAEKNYAQKGILISKALDILSELQGSLNVNKGGDLAERLQKLYFFCSSRLLTANLKMDVTKIDEVVGILTGLREAFVEANAMVATKAVPTEATQNTRVGVTAAPLGRNHLGAVMGGASLPHPGLTTRPLAQVRPAAPTSAVAVAAAVTTPPAAPTRPEVPVASATPPADTAVEADQEAAPSAPVVIETPRPAISPVRRAMAAYSQGRATG
ncbi:flagellar export chaperone FliS [Solidesulfovibrio magneticus]|uniref:Flagellar protein FliS n=1 Tax=Solidesulfovibrio magneticus (strain ATCC 700980 / DSM 13731 / RS-1) TaxID=573370 RepID=C4XHC0_SOLM1|nr:flagellar export chaperone FliS [Solidesulfovibrio magneticus]BAH73888.1 flagellar protein FliS [Solidesulfovibrio magneticus RS-1]